MRGKHWQLGIWRAMIGGCFCLTLVIPIAGVTWLEGLEPAGLLTRLVLVGLGGFGALGVMARVARNARQRGE